MLGGKKGTVCAKQRRLRGNKRDLKIPFFRPINGSVSDGETSVYSLHHKQ